MNTLARVAPPGFSWSASRAGVFADCPRGYWFQYYAATGKAPDVAPDEAAAAARLRQLTSLPLWIGARVHDTIEGLLRRARAGLAVGDAEVEAALERVVARMRGEYVASVRDTARATGDYRAWCRFHEHEYGRDVPRETWAARVEGARQMVRAWAAAGWPDRVRQAGPAGVRALEDLVEWSWDGAKIYLKVDLALGFPDGAVQVVDWKTGGHDRGENPLQMMVYALFARAAWNVDPARLDVREVYLRLDPPERPCRIDAAALDEGAARLSASIGAMLERLDDPARDAAPRDRFETRPGPRCHGCNFLALCPPGRAAVEDGR